MVFYQFECPITVLLKLAFCKIVLCDRCKMSAIPFLIDLYPLAKMNDFAVTKASLAPTPMIPCMIYTGCKTPH